MASAQYKLRDLGLGARFGMVCVVVTLLGGFAASFMHMVEHHSNRDENPGLSMDDIRGAYHGVRTTAPMIAQLQSDHPADVSAEAAEAIPLSDRETLLEWLAGDRISEDYDNLDLGDAAPAEIIAIGCLDCHSRRSTQGDGVGQRVPLDYWDDVKKVSFSREINPTSIEILTTSTHTHALSMAMVTCIIFAMALMTSWPRRLVHSLVFLGGAALLADLAAQWLARPVVESVWMIVIAGGIYGLTMVVTLLAVFLDLCLPRRTQ